MVTLRGTSKFEKNLTQLVQSAMEDKVFPGIEILVSRGKQLLFHETFGTRLPGSPESKLKKNSLFDLASLTKPLATTPAILHLYEQGKLKLDDRLRTYIPEFQQKEIEQVTLRHLLTHSSGLPDWSPLYDPGFKKSAGWEKLYHIPLENSPGKKVVYSCLGFIALAEVVRRISKMRLSDYCRNHLYLPWGLTHLMFNPRNELPDVDFVPTGYCPLRHMELNGTVHDENAGLFDGEGGNSGLFGTADNIYKLCSLLLEESENSNQPLLKRETIQMMMSNQNPEPLTPRGLGWDIKKGVAEYWSCSDDMPEGSVGHLGFTGTSLWLDPRSKLVIVLLSNRVIYSREDNIPLMRVFRPQMHALLLSRFLAS